MRPAFKRYVKVLPGGEFEKTLGAGTVIPVPMCFTPEQAAEWAVLAKQSRESTSCGFCMDCTPEFQSAMKDAGLCDNPGVEFRHNRKEGVYGVLL